jgi:hypothetical protein
MKTCCSGESMIEFAHSVLRTRHLGEVKIFVPCLQTPSLASFMAIEFLKANNVIRMHSKQYSQKNSKLV